MTESAKPLAERIVDSVLSVEAIREAIEQFFTPEERDEMRERYVRLAILHMPPKPPTLPPPQSQP